MGACDSLLWRPSWLPAYPISLILLLWELGFSIFGGNKHSVHGSI